MINSYVKAMDVVYRLCIWLAGTALVTMTAAYSVAIYARFRPDMPAWLNFMPHASTSWPEPLSNLCMIIFSFVGAAAAYRAGGHIAITMLTDNVGPGVKLVLRYFVDICMFITCILIIKIGFDQCLMAWHDPVASLPILTSGFTHMAVPVGSAITLLFVIERLIAGPQTHREIVRFGSPNAGH